jgi:hypothetical protein
MEDNIKGIRRCRVNLCGREERKIAEYCGQGNKSFDPTKFCNFLKM